MHFTPQAASLENFGYTLIGDEVMCGTEENYLLYLDTRETGKHVSDRFKKYVKTKENNLHVNMIIVFTTKLYLLKPQEKRV
jgi:hypothetical protein